MKTILHILRGARSYFLLILLLLFWSISASAHTFELRAKLNPDGSATFYARTYHIISSPSGSFIIDGVSYPFQGVFNQASLPGGTVLISKCNYTFASTDYYQYVTVPNFNSCGTYTFSCSSGAVEAPVCNLTNSLNLGEAQITLQPAFANGVACVGSAGYLAVEASGPDLSFQWQKWDGSSFVNMTDDATYGNTNSSTLTIAMVTAEMSGDRFRCYVSATDNCDNTTSTTSNDVTLTPGFAPGISGQPQSVATCAGSNISFSVAATGTNLSYQWKVSTNSGSSWSNTGSNAATLNINSVPVGNHGYQYRVDVSGSCGNLSSQVANLSVYNGPSFSSQPQSKTVCEGNAVSFSAGATGDGISYQWQRSTDAGATWSDVNGAAATALDFVPALNESGHRFRLMVAGTCTTTYSDAAEITVHAWTEKITGQSSSAVFTNNNNWTLVDGSIVVNESSSISGAIITIAENFASGDVLQVSGGLPAEVSQSYDSQRGILTINGTLTPAEMQDVFRRVEFRSNNASTSARKISYSLGTAIPSANGHFYEYVSASLTWTAAKLAAQARNFNGMQGYLATVTSQEENDFIRSRLTSDGWIGGSDDYSYVNAAAGTTLYASQSDAEGHWYWVTGPEAGQKISTGNGTPVTAPGAFANWAGGEPNNSGGEHYMQLYFGNGGRWNDLPNGNQLGYIVEYGGLSTDPCSNLLFEKTMLVNQAPQVSAVSNQAHCENSRFTINFSVSDDGGADNIDLAVTSDNSTLLPAGSYTLTTTGNGNYQLDVAPVAHGVGTVTITATDIYGATASRSFVADLAANPVVNFAVNAASQCFSQNDFRFTNSSTVAAGTLNYNWNFGEGNSSGSISPVHSFTQAGSYSVTLTATSNRGCTGEKSMAVTLLPEFTITVVAAETHLVCNPATTQLTVTPTNGTGNIAYTMEKNDGSTETKVVNSQSPAVFTVSGGSYTITALNGNPAACAATATAAVTQLGRITASLEAVNATCYGTSNGAIYIGSVSGGTAPYSFSLGGNSYTASDNNGFRFENLAPGVFNTYVKDANGCIQPIGTSTILQPAAIKAIVTEEALQPCNSSETQISVNATGGKGNYQFRLDEGSFRVSGQFVATAGNHSLTIVDGAGCQTSTTITVSSLTSLTIAPLMITDNTCIGGTLGGVSVLASGAASTVTYRLTGEDGVVYNQTMLAGDTADFIGFSSGNYLIQASDAAGCSGTVSVTIADPQQVTGTNNGAADLHVNLLSPKEYVWSATTGNIITLTYQVSSTSQTNVAARGVIVRVTKLFNSWSLSLADENSPWEKLPETGMPWTEFRLKSGHAINCGNSMELNILMERRGHQTTTGAPMSASARFVSGNQDLNEGNNFTSVEWTVQ